MTTFRVLRTFGSAALYSPHRLKLETMMQGQCKKKKIYDVQTRQLWVQILGNASDSTSRSLVLVADNKRYMFNCGESTQRDFQQYSSKLLRTERIFLTSANWQNLGGLSATLLMIDRAHTTRDRDITIYGPQNMNYLLKCLQNFVQLRNSDVSFECSEEGVIYIDQSVAVKCMHLRKDGDEASEKLEQSPVASDKGSDLSSTEDETKADNNSKRKISEGDEEEHDLKKQKTLDKSVPTKRITDVFCYICETRDIPGKLLIEKCMEKGVPAGPMLSKLKAGEDITLDNGTVVLSKDVCLPAKPGAAIMVVECPTEEYINSLTNHTMFRQYQSSETEKELFCIFHFTPEPVLQNPQYQAWMKQFKDCTHHVILNEKNKRSVIESSRKLQYKLNLLHPEIFPLFAEDSLSTDESKIEESNPYFHRAEPQMKIHLQPEFKFETMHPECDRDGYIREAMAVEGFPEVLADIKSKIEASPKYQPSVDTYPRVVFLGTGSALGTTVRNVSAILLRIDDDHNILLDCGDGTVRQIYTMYGMEKGMEIVSKIKGIFVSHMHADHHSGLIGVLKARATMTDEPVHLIAPAPLFSFLNHYDTVFEPVCSLFRYACCLDFIGDSPARKPHLNKALGVAGISTGRVVHTAQSFAIRLKLRSGFSIAYSGDTRPCEEMVRLARNVDLLLHEATLSADQITWALKTKHSTVPEALDIVRRSEAKHAILTHVSQRYSKAPITTHDTLPKNVGVACDFMDISMNVLPLLNDLYRGVYALNDPNADKFTLKQLNQMEFGRVNKAGQMS